jgi:hypothetical protein
MRGVGREVVFVSLETGEPCTLEESIKESKRFVQRMESVVVLPSDELYVIHWKTPTGHTGHGSPISMYEIRALFNDKTLQFDSMFTDKNGTKHWFVKQE